MKGYPEKLEEKDIVLYFKSSENMEEVLDGSVALIVTSPPYYNYIQYGEVGIGTEGSYKEYLQSLKKVIQECYRVTMPGGKMIINVSNMKARSHIEKSSFLYPIVCDVIQIAREVGFVFFDEIIWVKGYANNGALKGKPLFGSYPYPPTPKILDSVFENILIFKKEGNRKVPERSKELSKLTKTEWQVYTRGVWFIEPDRKALHPAVFPLEIPYRLIKMYSFVEDIVLDPFAGTGTTLLACKILNRKGIGYEINPDYYPEAAKKIKSCIQSTINFALQDSQRCHHDAVEL